MHFVYIDDSGDNDVACFSALIIPADQWRTSIQHLLEVRRSMRVSDGVYVTKEIHSTDWLAGKGKIAQFPISKERRARLFDYYLSGIALLPSAQLINACVSRKEKDRAFEYLLNRLQVNMSKAGSRCVVFCDEGKSYDAIKRRIGIHNFIQSQFGNWEDGNTAMNLPTDRLLEDIVYRNSNKSIFVQAADACAYSLLRREQPIPSKTALGLDNSFYILEKIMVKNAYGRDEFGIIR
ncbi:DUF3800 domain-containing protein [Sneathiella sp. HT1-7]|uniref:DUF3800 domain-containing protein n=1 Tax=Sneathiella sp. HT1-7 TaxID=2887192 RepID=UPI001D1574E1|nr:DUF3800 domain-containing protein [Sneathiella sp. HT1-7]MCC3305598.1 DUF3800 domain-containing protein [Sneathiella sp. HT1-7]